MLYSLKVPYTPLATIEIGQEVQRPQEAYLRRTEFRSVDIGIQSIDWRTSTFYFQFRKKERVMSIGDCKKSRPFIHLTACNCASTY